MQIIYRYGLLNFHGRSPALCYYSFKINIFFIVSQNLKNSSHLLLLSFFIIVLMLLLILWISPNISFIIFLPPCPCKYGFTDLRSLWTKNILLWEELNLWLFYPGQRCRIIHLKVYYYTFLRAFYFHISNSHVKLFWRTALLPSSGRRKAYSVCWVLTSQIWDKCEVCKWQR